MMQRCGISWFNVCWNSVNCEREFEVKVFHHGNQSHQQSHNGWRKVRYSWHAFCTGHVTSQEKVVQSNMIMSQNTTHDDVKRVALVINFNQVQDVKRQFSTNENLVTSTDQNSKSHSFRSRLVQSSAPSQLQLKTEAWRKSKYLTWPANPSRRSVGGAGWPAINLFIME